jgi:hypothetical protein
VNLIKFPLDISLEAIADEEGKNRRIKFGGEIWERLPSCAGETGEGPRRGLRGETRTDMDRHGQTRAVAELVNKEYRWEFSPPSRSGLGGRMLGGCCSTGFGLTACTRGYAYSTATRSGR